MPTNQWNPSPGFGQQQALQQQQFYQQAAYNIYGYTTSSSTALNIPAAVPAKAAPPEPETAVKWLDRRVSEMRVAL